MTQFEPDGFEQYLENVTEWEQLPRYELAQIMWDAGYRQARGLLE